MVSIDLKGLHEGNGVLVVLERNGMGCRIDLSDKVAEMIDWKNW